MSRRVSPSTDQVYGLQRVARIRACRERPSTAIATSRRRSGAEPSPPSSIHPGPRADLRPDRRGPGGPAASLRELRSRSRRRHHGRSSSAEPMIRARRDGRPQPTEGPAECVGLHVSRSAGRLEALEPVRQGVRERFGAVGQNVATGLALRHDHGSQDASHHFQAESRCLGITSSPAFVREPKALSAPLTSLRGIGRSPMAAPGTSSGCRRRPALGPALRHGRGAAPGAAGVRARLQPDPDHRTARRPNPSPGPSRSARSDAHGRVSPDRCLRALDRCRTSVAAGSHAGMRLDGLRRPARAGPSAGTSRTAGDRALSDKGIR